ncbi:MAG: LPS export ABC transporter periplasmic protein LptC [Treponema sp.]|jgi:LPS export ABC transporter protein LptC|nr:LPS export ABC transporter periplasmic protein LptC [Treponema sp.]
MKRLFLYFFLITLGSCSFDYQSLAPEDESQPDLIMDEVEYVRVRDGSPVVRFEAEHAERYEKRQTMELKRFSFEQFEQRGDEVNAAGSAGAASVELESGNIRMDAGVRIAVDSEDVVMETAALDWADKERRLSAGESAPVDIQRSDGTTFTGWGFSADVRQRTWSFTGGATGTYVHEDDEEPEAEGGGE